MVDGLLRRLDGVLVVAPRKAARRGISARTTWQKVCLVRAKSCLRLANQIAEWGPPFRPAVQESLCESIGLLRWGCIWLLAYEREMAPTFEAVLSQSPGAIGIDAAAGDEEWALLRGILERDAFVDASLPLEQAQADRDELRSLALRLLAIRETPEREVRRLTRRAFVRVAAMVAVALGLAGLGYWRWVVVRRGPDLAAGRPWKASSTLASCDPAHASCAGATTNIFFHTTEEDSPWVQIDLGGRKWVHRVDVRNRLDCCEERAVPLAIEISDDGMQWVEVARKYDAFDDWTAIIARTQARYVRLRVLRKSFLHLEEVVIR